MTRRKFRPAKKFVRRHASTWDRVHTGGLVCGYHGEGQAFISRGAAVLFKFIPGSSQRMPCCVSCALKYFSLTPPDSLDVQPGTVQWHGPDGRALRSGTDD